MVLLGNEYYKNKELNMKIEKLNFENSELKKILTKRVITKIYHMFMIVVSLKLIMF